MKNQQFKFEYQGKDIEFDLSEKSLMVNATEMAKTFDRKVEPFMRNESTIAFIEEALKSENSSFFGIEKEEDLVVSKQKSGTWMHRILALKFAAWLNPAFELWVYLTIDQILYGYYKEIEEDMKQSALRKTKMEKLEQKLMESNPDFQYLEYLRLEERQAIHKRTKRNRNQMDIFKNVYTDSSQSH